MGGSFSKKKKTNEGGEPTSKGGKSKASQEKNTNGEDANGKQNGSAGGKSGPTSTVTSSPSQTDESDVGDDIVKGSKKVRIEFLEMSPNPITFFLYLKLTLCVIIPSHVILKYWSVLTIIYNASAKR
jgi:hypothetical protein